jgi:AraC-like DNA-binding protein/quercetin dioxygenase-like cupin family protein
MKPIVQHIPLQPNTSFLASTFKMPDFETRWHGHEANELILVKEGNGFVTIGNYESIYKPGDIYFLGSNLPHRLHPDDNTTEVIIVQFKEDCLGKDFMDLPECLPLKHLFQIATHGIQITGKTRNQLQSLIETIKIKNEVNRIILLLQCLQIIALDNNENIILNTTETSSETYNKEDNIEKIIKYTNTSFHEPVTLSQVAALACKSIPSFCYYFKRMTQKTYIHYLNEVRIAHACNQLLQTNKPVVEIGYESGYNTVAHFHRQFFRLKKTTPLQYRKLFSTSHLAAFQTK